MRGVVAYSSSHSMSCNGANGRPAVVNCLGFFEVSVQKDFTKCFKIQYESQAEVLTRNVAIRKEEIYGKTAQHTEGCQLQVW